MKIRIKWSRPFAPSPIEQKFLLYYVVYGMTAAEAYRIVYERFDLKDVTLYPLASKLVSRLWVEVYDVSKAFSNTDAFVGFARNAAKRCKDIQRKHKVLD